MTNESLSRIEAAASRGDYTSMARLARALYQDGLDPGEVLRRCYGVAFPAEFFVIAEARPLSLDLPVDFTNQPWQLAIPLAQGGPGAMPDSMEETEQQIFAIDPDLLPLALFLDPDVQHGDLVICYRITELGLGRTTVFGVEEDPGVEDEAVPCGASLLTVLHEYHADLHCMLERHHGLPSNRGFGSIDAEQVAEARSRVERIEELRHRLAERTRGG
ncbi:hypothetical protein [Streptomyces olivaceoviridis]|uniref:hypothetical protein n=1 Tax=Streptomyces olivaceoviridis TaxID=1921 RepID=UPI0037B0C310